MTHQVDQVPETPPAAGGRQYATFFVRDLFFGIEVLEVQEVLRYQEMTCVPRAPEVIEGLINLRGQIVTALDMRRKLNLPRRPETLAPMNVVVRAADGAVSLLVDEIGDVVEVDQSSFEKVPDNVSSETRELVHGVYKLKDRLLLILDAAKAVEAGLSPTREQGA